MMNKFALPILSLVICLLLAACGPKNNQIVISADMENPMIRFVIDELKTACAGNGREVVLGDPENADLVFSLTSNDPALEAEGFRIQKGAKAILLEGANPAGLLYGGLEIAEQITISGWDGIQQTTQNPYMQLRGTKFNIPLDVRTPTYSDPSDAAQKNIPEMWNFDFWKDYIDNLARYRYNYISLWSLHPFPSMVKVPGYEDIALDDVLRSTVDWQENYPLTAIEFDAPEILHEPEVIKRMPIEEKIEFWRKVMRHAKERNIDFYVVTWNIFDYGTEGKYGITDAIDNPVTQDYFRKSVKEMFVTYPDLAGIGLTTGENMHGAGFEEKEDWAFDTYAQGTLDAAREMPDRRFTFIHRQHQTGAKDIAEKFAPLFARENIEFLFSFKYAQAHVMSATEQPFHENFVKDIEGMKTIWTLRNDDVYYFRWGAPDFVRTFIKNIPYEVSRGFYYGSDQWVWGREFLMKDPESPRQLEIVKHWYHWMLWGRLGYNPDITNERFGQILQQRFPEVEATSLLAAWQHASMIYPVTTGFHWGPLDFQWYIEACKSRPAYAQNETGFHDVNRFINLPPHPRSGFQSIPDYVSMISKEESSNLIPPPEVAKMLLDHSNKALEIIDQMDVKGNRELGFTLGDIRSMALLGRYYSHKISGATYLALFRETKDESHREKAVVLLTEALESWKKYVDNALKQNINPVWMNRVGTVDWQQIIGWVAHDIELAREGHQPDLSGK